MTDEPPRERQSVDRHIARVVALMAAHGFTFAKVAELRMTLPEARLEAAAGALAIYGFFSAAGLAFAYLALDGSETSIARARRNRNENWSALILGALMMLWVIGTVPLFVNPSVEIEPPATTEIAP